METTTPPKKVKARSPQYPAIGLKEAFEKIESVYKKDYQNPISRIVAVSHMGYNGLNGKSLGVLSALGKYGFLDGRGDENKVSDLAMQIIAHPSHSPERYEALKEAASKPELFSELDSRFSGGRVSDTALRSYLLTQKFIPSAADAVIRAYRETKQFLETEASIGLSEEQECKENDIHDDSAVQPPLSQPSVFATTASFPSLFPSDGVRQTVFALAEGDVTITFPEELSPESVEDLESYLEIFMKKAKREAGMS